MTEAWAAASWAWVWPQGSRPLSAGWFRRARKITAARRKMATASIRKVVAMDRFSTRAVVTGGRTMVAMPLPEAQMLRARARCW